MKVLYAQDTDSVYTPFRPWFRFAYGFLSILCLLFIALFLRSGNPLCLFGAALPIGGTFLLHCRYTAQAVLFRDYDLILCYGTLVSHEVSIPIWQATLSTQQGPLGRVCDYGTVQFQIDNEMIKVHTIARLHALRTQFAAHRRAFFTALGPQVHLHTSQFPPTTTLQPPYATASGMRASSLRLIGRSQARSGNNLRR